jgi:hypothetical protein
MIILADGIAEEQVLRYDDRRMNTRRFPENDPIVAKNARPARRLGDCRKAGLRRISFER